MTGLRALSALATILDPSHGSHRTRGRQQKSLRQVHPLTWAILAGLMLLILRACA